MDSNGVAAMNGVIGDILPLALAVAISPLPVIASILLLLAPGAKRKAVGFLVGWLAGIALTVIIFSLVSGLIGLSGNGAMPIVGTIKIVLGILMVLIAVRQWRRRPRQGSDAPMPKWMSAINSITAGRSIGLGLLLAAANPKNLMMGITAGVTVGSGDVSFGAATLAIVIYVLIAASTVAAPVIAYLFASRQMAVPLGHLREWLVANNSLILGLLLLVLGVVSIGKGIAAF